MYFPVHIYVLFNKASQWHAWCQWKKEHMGIKVMQVKQRGRSWKRRKSWWITHVVSMECFSFSFIWKIEILLCNLDDFCQPLSRVLTPDKEVGVCTSPKHHPLALRLWAHPYSLLIQTVYIFRRQQCFCPCFTGVTCPQDQSGYLGLFLHCWLSTCLLHQWSHVLTAITNRNYTQENKGMESLPSAGQQTQLLALVSPLWSCCPCKHLWFTQWGWGGASLQHRGWRYEMHSSIAQQQEEVATRSREKCPK